MKNKNAISILVFIITILSFAASLLGVFSSSGSGEYEFVSIFGETIRIYGKGIYSLNSVSVVSQGIAQDIITIILGVPLLLLSLYLTLRNSLKGKLLLTGTVAYFLYTYVSYAFLWMYNQLFLVYVIIMSCSLFAFILLMMSFDVNKLKLSFKEKLPSKALGIFQIVFGVLIALMWLNKIVVNLFDSSVSVGLEHYTTLVIQALDLGIIVPTAILSGILIIKKKPYGYLLSSIVIIKGISLATAVTAMVVSQLIALNNLGIVEIILFPLINLFIIYFLVLLLRNINEPEEVLKI